MIKKTSNKGIHLFKTISGSKKAKVTLGHFTSSLVCTGQEICTSIIFCMCATITKRLDGEVWILTLFCSIRAKQHFLLEKRLLTLGLIYHIIRD